MTGNHASPSPLLRSLLLACWVVGGRCCCYFCGGNHILLLFLKRDLADLGTPCGSASLGFTVDPVDAAPPPLLPEKGSTSWLGHLFAGLCSAAWSVCWWELASFAFQKYLLAFQPWGRGGPQGGSRLMGATQAMAGRTTRSCRLAGPYHLAWRWGGQQAGVGRAGLGGLLEAAPVCLDTPVGGGCRSVSQCPALPAKGTASGCGLQGSWDVLPLPWPLPCPCRLSAPGEWGAARRRASRAPIRPQAVAPAGGGRRAHTCSHAREAHTPLHAGGTGQSVPLGPRPAGCSFLGLVLQADPIRSRHRVFLFQNSRRKLESRTFSPTCDRSVPAVGAGRSEQRSGPAAPTQLRPQHRPGSVTRTSRPACAAGEGRRATTW